MTGTEIFALASHLVATTRADQGLPLTVDDPTALRSLATIITRGGGARG